jgi:hypothetical protein
VVKQLEALNMLCSPCAASAAAKTNQTEVIKHLVSGTGKILLQVCASIIAILIQEQKPGLLQLSSINMGCVRACGSL